MIKTSIELLAETIGFEIGTSDDITQSTLLNSFCKGLTNSSTNEHKMDLQLCYIADKLNTKTEKILLSLVEFIKIKNQ